jgi:photosystem II stability/assembly factor-like uncharacterized protein
MKKHLFQLAVSVVFTVIFVHTIGAQWIQMCEPVGPIVAIAINENTIFAGTENGVYVTSDYGTTWTAENYGLPKNRSVSSFVCIGDTIFAGIGGGVYISINNGFTWAAVTIDLANRAVSSLTVSGTTMYAGARYVTYGPMGGVFLSTNRGQNWTNLSNDNSLDVYALAATGNTIAVGTYYGVYLSTNKGKTWTEASLKEHHISSLAFIKSTLFAGTEFGVHRSTDNGKSWSLINPDVSDSVYSSINFLTVSGENVFVGTDKGVYRSADNGTTWTAVNSGLAKTRVNSLAVSGNNIYAGTVLGTVFVSTDNGTSWGRLNVGLASADVYHFLKTDSALFVETSAGIFRSTDNGINWAVLNICPPDASIRCMAASGNKILAAFQREGDYVGNIESCIVSKNNGNSWTAINSAIKDVWGSTARISSMEVIGDNIFAGTSDAGLFRSTDYGVNWSAINSGLPENISVVSLAKSGRTLFAGTESGFFSSKDLGARWTEINPDVKDPRVRCLAANAGSVIALIESRTCDERSLVLSADAGSKWTRINSGFPSTHINSLEYYGTSIFAVTNNGVLLSTNNGVSWTVVNTDQLKNITINSIAIFDNTLFVGTDKGEWHRPLSDVVGVVGNPDVKSVQPADFALRVIGAATSCAQIEFAVPRPEKVTLSVYDLLGHEIASPVNGNCAAGLHRVTWNTRNIASGWYTLRMRIGGNMFTNNISIIR